MWRCYVDPGIILIPTKCNTILEIFQFSKLFNVSNWSCNKSIFEWRVLLSEKCAVETCEHEINLEQKLNLLVPRTRGSWWCNHKGFRALFLVAHLQKCASVVQTLSTDLFQVNAALFYQRLLEITPKILLWSLLFKKMITFCQNALARKQYIIYSVRFEKKLRQVWVNLSQLCNIRGKPQLCPVVGGVW